MPILFLSSMSTLGSPILKEPDLQRRPQVEGLPESPQVLPSELTFNAPWEAQAFAITLAAHENGLFEWSEWSALLGSEIKKGESDGAPPDQACYYHYWLQALERIITQKGVASEKMLHDVKQAWQSAAERTPHGSPIELSPTRRGRS